MILKFEILFPEYFTNTSSDEEYTKHWKRRKEKENTSSSKKIRGSNKEDESEFRVIFLWKCYN